MKKPHKHADLIKAWADGAEIENRHEKAADDEWRYNPYPPFHLDSHIFRIKSKTKIKNQNKFESWSHENLTKFAQEASTKLAEKDSQLERADAQFKEVVKIADELAAMCDQYKKG